MSLVAAHSMHRNLLMNPSQKAHSLISAVVFGVKNAVFILLLSVKKRRKSIIIFLFLHSQGSGGQVEADSSTFVQL